jgi:hypothetical protein
MRLVLPVIPDLSMTAMACAAVLEALSRSGNPIRHPPMDGFQRPVHFLLMFAA